MGNHEKLKTIYLSSSVIELNGQIFKNSPNLDTVTIKGERIVIRNPPILSPYPKFIVYSIFVKKALVNAGVKESSIKYVDGSITSEPNPTNIPTKEQVDQLLQNYLEISENNTIQLQNDQKITCEVI